MSNLADMQTKMITA